jgi:hypothetical protein
MFWIELYLIIQISFWFVGRLGLSHPTGERVALVVLLGLGVKSFLLFVFIVLDLARFIVLPFVFSLLVFIFYFLYIRIRPSNFETFSSGEFQGKVFYELFGFLILLVLLCLSLINSWFFPIISADGIWHHVKGMIYSASFVDFESNQINSQFRQYPPFIGLTYGWLVSAGFERVQTLFPILYGCILFVFFHRIHDHIKNVRVAGMGTLVLGTTPYLWWHSFLPFLDWTASVFYTVGILYWFSLIKNFLAPTGSLATKQNRSLALLSGLFFGLASWTRPEFLIYSGLPLILLICVLDRQKEYISERNPLIVRFSIAALALPSLWFIVLLSFDSPLDHTFKQLIIGCVCIWIGLGLVLFRLVKLSYRTSINLGICVFIVLFIGLFIISSTNFSPWTVIMVRLFRLFAVQIFFAGTVFLLVFIFIEKLRQLPSAEKKLGVLLLLFILAQVFVFAYSGLKWPTFAHYVQNTFIHPGNSINLSDTRGSLAIYPAFVFFIFCFPSIQSGYKSGKIRQLLSVIVVVNLFIIITVFAGPRMKFIVDSIGKTYEERAEASGPSDLPNQFAKTYQVAHQLKKNVVSGQLLLLPPGNREGSLRSVMTQVLFSQKLIFANDSYLWKNFDAKETPFLAAVERIEENKLCVSKKSKILGNTGFVFCQIDKINFNFLE